MIGDLDRATPVPVAEPSAPRAGGLAWAVAVLIVGTTIAVDPAGLVPTGPLRWTVIAVTTGVTLGVLVLRPFAIPKRLTGLWLALIGVLAIATFNAVDPLHAWIGTPDRRLGLLAWITFPALFVAGHACTSRAATRLVLRAGTLAALVLGVWSAAEVLGHPPLGLEFADARAGGPFGQPAYLGAACLLIGPLAAAAAFDRNERAAGEAAGARRGRCTARARAFANTRGVGGRGRRRGRDRGARAWTPAPAPQTRDRSGGRNRRGRHHDRCHHATRRAGNVDVRPQSRHQREPLRRVAHRGPDDRRSSAARRRARGLPRRVPAGGRRRIRAQVRRRRVSRPRTTACST